MADAMKPISRVFVHRTLTTKFAKQYVDGQKARKGGAGSQTKLVPRKTEV
jgi:hypothetical protein